jgi:hypothetical protein
VAQAAYDAELRNIATRRLQERKIAEFILERSKKRRQLLPQHTME